MVSYYLHESFNVCCSHPRRPEERGDNYDSFFVHTQSAAHVPTQEERELALEEFKRKKEFEQNASEERKNFMQAMELKRKENARPSDLEEVHVVTKFSQDNMFEKNIIETNSI